MQGASSRRNSRGPERVPVSRNRTVKKKHEGGKTRFCNRCPFTPSSAEYSRVRFFGQWISDRFFQTFGDLNADSHPVFHVRQSRQRVVRGIPPADQAARRGRSAGGRGGCPGRSGHRPRVLPPDAFGQRRSDRRNLDVPTVLNASLEKRCFIF